ncbi:MAG: type I methionyl aminopeptidase [Thermaerobacter sp.]|nr:type I methionyl aminopeptidase [Thermaerobacter sp.]
MIVLKADWEIEKMRQAGALTAQARDYVAALVRPGVSTRELDEAARRFIEERGGTPSFLGYEGFPASICASVNGVVVHGIPGEQVLRDGDIISLDLGVIVDGYHGDTAITVPVGKVSPQVQSLLDTTRAALLAGLAKARPGNHLSDISNAVERIATAAGFSIVVDFVGHGIGREMHEDPQIPNYGPPGRGVQLRRGMVLAIEPMINMGGPDVRIRDDGWTVETIDGLPSAHFEHTVAVGDPPDVLTAP